jgi:hypothetical protein
LRLAVCRLSDQSSELTIRLKVIARAAEADAAIAWPELSPVENRIYRQMKNLILTFCALSFMLCPSAIARQGRALTLDDSRPEKRFALVIGNSDYEVAPLKNPLNDAQDMAQTLSGLGFEVIYKQNVGRDDMKRVIRSFGEKIRGGGTGLFYYAGHGLQVKGLNYLVPVDAKLSSEGEVDYECIEVGFVLAQMEDARNDMNIIILDACRNNPFSRSFRSMSRGLAPVNAPRGTLIAYATGPGLVASDGDGRNGIYTQELLKNIRVPGLGVEEVFKRVRISVLNLTQSKQIPWESSSLTRDFYFVGSKGSNRPARTETPSLPPVNGEPAPSGNTKVRSQTVKEKFFKFELEQCRLSGTTATCDLLITNDESEDRLLKFELSHLYDDQGNEARDSDNRIANKGYRQQSLLLSGTPVKAKVTFNNVSAQAQGISLLKLSFETIERGWVSAVFTVEFRNVSIIK